MNKYIIEYEYQGDILSHKVEAASKNQAIELFMGHFDMDYYAVYELTTPIYPPKSQMIQDILQKV